MSTTAIIITITWKAPLGAELERFKGVAIDVCTAGGELKSLLLAASLVCCCKFLAIALNLYLSYYLLQSFIRKSATRCWVKVLLILLIVLLV